MRRQHLETVGQIVDPMPLLLIEQGFGYCDPALRSTLARLRIIKNSVAEKWQFGLCHTAPAEGFGHSNGSVVFNFVL